jgi:hypothetical protein
MRHGRKTLREVGALETATSGAEVWLKTTTYKRLSSHPSLVSLASVATCDL